MELEYIWPFLSGAAGAALITGIFGVLMYKIKRKDEQGDATVLALRMLLYDRIKHNGKACIERGNITAEELEDLIQMHGVYHTNLKGNGFLDELMSQVRKLPIV